MKTKVAKCSKLTSLVVQWIRIHLSMQRTWFDPWSGKIPHAMGQLRPCTTAGEPEPGACAQ